MTISQDWQMEFGSVLVGAGQSYRIKEIEGLADYPDLRINDRSRLRRDGLLSGDDFLGGRSVVATLEVPGGTTGALAGLLGALKAALRPGQVEAPLTLQVPGIGDGGVMRLLARPRRFASKVDTRWRFAQPAVAIEFFATDPRIYDNDQQSLSTGLATSVAGLSWNLSWNLNWGGASTGNIILANNAGTYSTPWTARIDGPVTNPTIENVTTGQKLIFTADGGLVVGAGEFLTVDADARTVLLGGTASRYSKLSSLSSWWELAPGTTQLRFSGTTAGAPQLTVTFRSAWI